MPHYPARDGKRQRFDAVRPRRKSSELRSRVLHSSPAQSADETAGRKTDEGLRTCYVATHRVIAIWMSVDGCRSQGAWSRPTPWTLANPSAHPTPVFPCVCVVPKSGGKQGTKGQSSRPKSSKCCVVLAEWQECRMTIELFRLTSNKKQRQAEHIRDHTESVFNNLVYNSCITKCCYILSITDCI